MMSMVLQVCYQVNTKQLLDNYDVYGIYNIYSVYGDFQSLLMQTGTRTTVLGFHV
jgi:hypothetical protein